MLDAANDRDISRAQGARQRRNRSLLGGQRHGPTRDLLQRQRPAARLRYRLDDLRYKRVAPRRIYRRRQGLGARFELGQWRAEHAQHGQFATQHIRP